LIDDVDRIAGHGHTGRTVTYRQCAEADRVTRDAPPGLGLPPVIEDRNLENLLGPLNRRRVRAFAGKEKGTEFRKIVFPDQFAFRIFLLDRAEGGGRSEQRDDAVLGYHAP